MSWLASLGVIVLILLIFGVAGWIIWVTHSICDLLDMKEAFEKHIKVFNDNVDIDTKNYKQFNKRLKKLEKMLKGVN